MGKLSRWPLHPLGFAVYPVLALLAVNAGQVRPIVGARWLLGSVVVAALVLLILRLLALDAQHAAALTSLAVLLFYSYGPTYMAMRPVKLFGESLGRHRYLVPVWLVLAVVLAVAILRRRGELGAATTLLNGAALVLVGFSLGRIVWTSPGQGGVETPSIDLNSLPGTGLADAELPDVYYILLDGYARADTLLQSYGLDNSGFLDSLRGLGFYVAECSMSNYSQTEPNLASTLNMDYLEQVVGPLDETSDDRSPLWPAIRHSIIRSYLEGLGYTTYAFETGFRWSELDDADHYLAPKTSAGPGLNAFEATLLRSTIAWVPIDAIESLPGLLSLQIDRSADAHRVRLQFVLDELTDLPSAPGPKFVFAHVVSPHRPFVFDAAGNPVDDSYDWARQGDSFAGYAEGYREQTGYLNSRMLPILEGIVSRSDRKVVVVVHSDHGPGEGSADQRMRNLIAVLLPDTAPYAPYPDLSPVNLFRLVLSDVFGADLALLSDRSRFSEYDTPFLFREVEGSCPEPAG